MSLDESRKHPAAGDVGDASALQDGGSASATAEITPSATTTVPLIESNTHGSPAGWAVGADLHRGSMVSSGPKKSSNQRARR